MGGAVIVEWFVRFAMELTAGLLGLLPDIDVDVGALGPAFSMMLALNEIAPVAEALAAAMVVLAVTGLMFFLKVLQTLIAHVPGIGGGGA